jgi:hypothetical protein
MAPEPTTKPTFSRSRRWSIAFNVLLSIVGVLALVVMANYLNGKYFRRFYLSSHTRVELSTRTISLLRSITNKVNVTLYYDKDEDVYADLTELLKEYTAANPKISVTAIDYYRDPGAAQEMKLKYNLGSSTNRNLVIFDCGGRTKIVNGEALVTKQLIPMPSKDPMHPEFLRKAVEFCGESLFSGALLTVVNPKPMQAYFLQGHGEHILDDTTEFGYTNFAEVFQQNYVQLSPLTLLGTNTVPSDCNLLIIAGPRDPLPPSELDQIDRYLDEGGRLMMLFNVTSSGKELGLEKILAKWGVQIGSSIVKDPENTTSPTGTDIIVADFRNSPAVNPLIGSRLQLILPRPVSRIDLPGPAKDTVTVQEIAFSGSHSYLQRSDTTVQKPQAWPLMAVVERNQAKGAIAERGLLRILVLGDSLFLGNHQIEGGANRDFAGYAINWLMDRNYLLEGVGPRPIDEYRLLISKNQMRSVQWILLGAIPGGIMLFGGLVWFRRRK